MKLKMKNNNLKNIKKQIEARKTLSGNSRYVVTIVGNQLKITASGGRILGTFSEKDATKYFT